jgi:medium-chain acyl-[acyl-carrier-protein] hydrolase
MEKIMLISSDGWIHYPRPNKQAVLRLFCFPGMGGHTSLYAHWPELLPASIEVCVMQYPGRLPEPDTPNDMELPSVIEAMAEAISQHQDRPFAIFGHCLGAIFVYEVAQQLRLRSYPGPDQLFIASFVPPHLLQETLPFVLTTPTGSEIFSRISYIRSQQRVLDLFQIDGLLWKQYRYSPGEPFDCPVTAFGAEREHLFSLDQLSTWKTYTTGRFALQMFPGHHNFFYNDAQPLLKAITEEMLCCHP